MIKSFLGNKNGNFAIMFGIMSVPFMLAAGTAIDYGNMVRTRAELQSSLDAAAMQMAFKATSMTSSQLEAFGNQVLLANMDGYIVDSNNPPILHYYGLTTEADGSQTLKAGAEYDYVLLFIDSVMQDGKSSRKISANSNVRSRAGDPACVYALDYTAQRAIEVSGGAKIIMDGCVIASNSNDDESIYAGGSAKIHADCAQAAGLINTGSSMTTDCALVRENAWTLDDPFADVPEPPRPVSLTANPKVKDTTMGPGRYYKLTLDGPKHLNPGIYYIEGDLTIHGDLTGSGVFIFMKDGTLNVNGNASLSLQAPTLADVEKYPSLGLDPYYGLLFMSARDNLNPMSFNGTGKTELDGFVYATNGMVDYAGNNGTTSTCLRIVADTIKLTGSTDMKSDCSEELGGREALTSGAFYYSL